MSLSNHVPVVCMASKSSMYFSVQSPVIMSYSTYQVLQGQENHNLRPPGLVRGLAYKPRCLLPSVRSVDVYVPSTRYVSQHVESILLQQMVSGKKTLRPPGACLHRRYLFLYSCTCTLRSWPSCSRPTGASQGNDWPSWQRFQPHQSQKSPLSSESLPLHSWASVPISHISNLS